MDAPTRKGTALNPVVSVIVPVYNVEPYVGECLASLQAQTFRDFEAVCVNDGCTDESPAVLERFADEDQRFRIVDQENGGLSAARNKGLDSATGTYVCFLDSDDKFAPQTLEHLVAAAEEHELDLVDFASDTFYESDAVKHIHAEERHRDDIPGVHSGAHLLCEYEERGQYFPSACYHLVRRDLLARISLRFEEGLLHEDELFTPLLHAYAGRSMFLNEKLYLRRMRENSIMTTLRGVRNVVAEFRIVVRLVHWLESNAASYDERFLHAFGQHIYLLADYMTGDALTCTEEELRAAASQFNTVERVLYELVVVQHRNGTARLRASYEDSKTYRAGRALTSLPRAIRSIGK